MKKVKTLFGRLSKDTESKTAKQVTPVAAPTVTSPGSANDHPILETSRSPGNLSVPKTYPSEPPHHTNLDGSKAAEVKARDLRVPPSQTKTARQSIEENDASLPYVSAQGLNLIHDANFRIR